MPSAFYGTRSVPTTLELNNLFLRGRFLRDLARQFRIDPAGIGIGLTLKGTAGKQRLAVREEGMRQSFHMTPPVLDGLRFVRPPSDEDWTVNGVAGHAADEILEHWSFWGEPWVGRPEFKDAVYQGSYFRNRFQGF